jgi:nitrate reductase NapD
MNHENGTETVGCIVGAVLRLKPGEDAQLARQLEHCDGVEIHGGDAQSRLVITLEAPDSRSMLRLSETIQQMDGVLQLTPVYQYCDDQHNDEQTGGWKWR